MNIMALPVKATRYSIRARPVNCSLKLKEDERCPNCKQVHLRPGYCQALDPINAKQYPHLRQSHEADINESQSQNRETETGDETEESQPWIAAGVSRATYFRRKASEKNELR